MKEKSSFIVLTLLALTITTALYLTKDYHSFYNVNLILIIFVATALVLSVLWRK